MVQERAMLTVYNGRPIWSHWPWTTFNDL